MTCYYPLDAIISNRSDGRRKISFPKMNPITGKYNPGNIKLPCGQCTGCRLDRSRDWAVRCVHEASLHIHNCFVTLTYSDDHLPVVEADDGFYVSSLDKRDVQLFMKRLRRRFPCLRIRFFLCGEYGEKLQRPHYHLILFGFDFHDKYFFKKSSGCNLYRSSILEGLWTYGHSSIAAVNFDTAAYVARYCLKKVNGVRKESHYKGILPEFSLMSRKPGIAKTWFDNNLNDVFPHDYLVLKGGMKCKPPRYYDKIYDNVAPDNMLEIKEKRVKIAKSSSDNSKERLLVREKVKLSQLSLLKRSIE